MHSVLGELRDDLDAFLSEEAEALRIVRQRQAAGASASDIEIALRAAEHARANARRVRELIAEEEHHLAQRHAGGMATGFASSAP